MPSQIRVGSLWGIPLFVHLSALPLLALVIGSLGLWWYPYYGTEGVWTIWILASVSGVGFVASLVLHEMAHAVIARRYHMDPRRITLFALGAVVELNDEPRTPRSEFFMALAGPFFSLSLGAVFFCLMWADIGLWSFCFYIALLNLALFAFNLIPAFPMDGGRVVRALVWKFSQSMWLATKIAGRLGQLIGLLMIAGGGYVLFSDGEWTGLWWAFLGVFVIHAAGSALRELNCPKRPKVVSQIMRPVQMVSQAEARGKGGVAPDKLTSPWESMVVIDPKGNAVGVVFKSQGRSHFGPIATIPESRSLEEAEALLLAKGLPILVVTRWGKPVGQINVSDILAAKGA